MGEDEARREFAGKAGEIVGKENVGWGARSEDDVVIRPATAEEASGIIQLAREFKQQLIPSGAGTKVRGVRGNEPASILEMTRMKRILSYDPGDLTISVEAGCKLRDLQAAAAEQGQFLAFEPPFADGATIGGCLAANSWNLCREGYGRTRDFVLGMEFINGLGERVHSGGKVVKNVTGYDMHKLMIGSRGTLGAIASVNFRLYPLLREGRMFAAGFENANNAFSFLESVRDSHLKPQTLVALNPGASRLLRKWGWTMAGEKDEWMAAAIVRGRAAVMDRHEREIREISRKDGGRFAVESGEEMERGVKLLREFSAKAEREENAELIARIGVWPMQARSLLEKMETQAAEKKLAYGAMYRASGAAQVVFSGSKANLTEMAARLLDLAESHHADAAIEACPLEVQGVMGERMRARADAALMQKVKSVFDPMNVFGAGPFAGALMQ